VFRGKRWGRERACSSQVYGKPFVEGGAQPRKRYCRNDVIRTKEKFKLKQVSKKKWNLRKKTRKGETGEVWVSAS